MNNKERAELVGNCKWVDSVLSDVPYLINVDFINQHNIDFVLHGDDLIYDENGEGIYTKFEKIGRFK